MAADIKTFTGKADPAINRDWIKDITPKGSRLIAYIDLPDPVHTNDPHQYAVFQATKGGALSVFMFIQGIGISKLDKPHAAIKHITENQFRPTITSLIPEAELHELFKAEAVTEEEKAKAREASRLPATLRAMKEKLQWIYDWQKLELVTDPEDMKNVLYYLNCMATDCIIMASNLSQDLIEKMESQIPQAPKEEGITVQLTAKEYEKLQAARHEGESESDAAIRLVQVGIARTEAEA